MDNQLPLNYFRHKHKVQEPKWINKETKNLRNGEAEKSPRKYEQLKDNSFAS